MVCRNEESLFFLCNPLPGNFMISRTCLSPCSVFNQDGWLCLSVTDLFNFLNMVGKDEDSRNLNIYVWNIYFHIVLLHWERGRIPSKGKRLDETKKELSSGKGKPWKDPLLVSRAEMHILSKDKNKADLLECGY